MGVATEIEMAKFEVTMYEKAEHWTFEVSVTAQDEAAARRQLSKDYSPRSYSIRRIQQVRN